MNNATPSPDFEKKMQAAASAPSADPEFVNRLRAQVIAASEAPGPSLSSPKHYLLPGELQKIVQSLCTGFSQLASNKAPRPRRILSAVGALALIIGVIFIALNLTTPVSAQQILERATAAQSAAASGQGIRHVRIEHFENLLGQSGIQAGNKTLIESYENASNGVGSSQILAGHFRSITTDANGKIVDAGASDGSFYYSTYPNTPGTLTIHRTPVGEDGRKKLIGDGTAADERAIFDQFRSNPRVELVGKETQANGSQVYRLIDRNYQIEAQPNAQEAKTFTGSMTMIFDAQTYQLVETERMVRKGGEDIVLDSVRFLTNEILPADSAVAWDLSDLKGARMVDDAPPQADPAANVQIKTISEHELAAHVQAYVLKPLPEGFTQAIIYAPRPSGQDHDVAEVNYQKQGEDVFGMMFVGVMDAGFVDANFYDGSYKTASGLVINFSTGSGKGTSGILTVPDGTSFLLGSSLPREQVQKLAETLVPAQ
jgi:hypothetical protein